MSRAFAKRLFGGALGISLGAMEVVQLASPRSARALTWPDAQERVEQELASPSPATRLLGVHRLETLSRARATPLIARALGDPDTSVRLAAAKAAGHLRIDGAVEFALPWLVEPDARLRAAACELAGQTKASGSVPLLVRALGDADVGVRAACADAIGAQGSPDAVEPLAAKLDDPAPSVRIRVATALGTLGDVRGVVPLIGKIQDAAPEVRQAVVRALGTLADPRAVPALLLSLRDPAPEVRLEALGALGRMRAVEAPSSIAPLALDRDGTVREAALAALGNIATTEAIGLLVKHLGTGDDGAGEGARTAVRTALVATGSKAVPALVALLDRPPSKAAANSAAWILGELRATSSASAVVRALRRSAISPESALHALAGTGTSAEVPVVLEFLTDKRPAVRSEATLAASALLDPTHPDGRAVEPLVAALHGAHGLPSDRVALVTLLGKTGAPRAGAALLPLLSSSEPALRLATIDALGTIGEGDADAATGRPRDAALVALLAASDLALRWHAALALAESGGVAAQDELLRALDGEPNLDRRTLLAALGGILERKPNEAAVTRLLRELELAPGAERDAILEATGRARTQASMKALASALQGDVDDRRSAVALLAAHPADARARSLVLGALRDPDAGVRAAAAFALGTLGDETSLSTLASLSTSTVTSIATNATAAMATLTRRSPQLAAGTASVACRLLDDARATVRTNALVIVASSQRRCSDGQRERELLAHDKSELVRVAAARALLATPNETVADRNARATCAATDRSARVAAWCRGGSSEAPTQRSRAGGVTVFIAGDADGAPSAHAPFLLEYATGALRAGIADRRGATFDPAPAPGPLTLRSFPVP